MRIYIFVTLLCIVTKSFAVTYVIGFQNGLGQSFELNRQDVNSLWGYRGNLYTDVGFCKNLMFQSSLFYSQKGSLLKIYFANEYGIDKSRYIGIESRSQIVGYSLCLKPYFDLQYYRIFVATGPRIDYMVQRVIDDTPLGGSIQDITKSTTKWIPGINFDLGCSLKLKHFLLGIIFNNEIDLGRIKADFGERFKSYKYSIMFDVGYDLNANKN